ncbi:MAG: (deoxy)nucleoside triphosphate pyrophosphohydrolase [Legionellales bacterium]|nr:(deoxy)nucleoside triphosphate pyrophosphohydrolase [Legionellales bacterium]
MKVYCAHSIAIGVITDPLNRILITQRAADDTHGGLWEFPGGKLKAHETASEALCRELEEELGLHVSGYQYLCAVQHTYADGPVSFEIFHVHEYLGNATCREAQMGMKWVEKKALSHFEFPPANLKIIEVIIGK